MYLAISSYSVLRLGLAGCRCCVMDILRRQRQRARASNMGVRLPRNGSSVYRQNPAGEKGIINILKSFLNV